MDSESSDVDRVGYLDMIQDEQYSEQLNIFYKIVTDYMSEFSKDKESNKQILNDVLNIHVEKCKTNKYLKILKNLIKKILPNILLEKYRLYTQKKNKEYILEHYKEYLSNDEKVNIQWNEIKHILRKYNEK